MLYFDDVTLLVTHYNRSDSLERLLAGFRALDVGFESIVVSDDGSQPQHLEKLRALQEAYAFELVTTPVNKGLGNNINKGQRAVKTNYTLYIQEDFIPKPALPGVLQTALKIMQTEAQWDMITLYSYKPYPYQVPYKSGFSEKKFRKSLWYSDHVKFYVYGDHPHLRRSNFLEKFGDYKEGVNGDQTEMAMALSFIKNKGRALIYDDLFGLLDQKNTTAEPSTADFRKDWRQSKAWHVQLMRKAYLVFKLLKLTRELKAIKPVSSSQNN